MVIRHGRIQAVYSIGDAEAEVNEAQVLSTSPIAGKRLRDGNWPEGASVGAILKRGQLIVPRGDTLIEEGDVMCVFAMSSDVVAVEHLFQVSIDFF